jgi:hypothetical protein
MKRPYPPNIVKPALLAISALMLSAPFASPVTAQDVALAPPSADAITLAGLLVPRDLFIEINLVNFDKSIPILAQQNPQLAALFTSYPGLDVEMATTGRAELQKILLDEYPGLAEKVSVFVAQRYSPAEIKVLNAFYNSPAGIKLIRNEYQGADTSGMIEAFTDRDGKLTMDEVKAMDANSGPLNKDLTSAEQAAATKFFLGPVGRKIGQNKDGFQQLTVTWVNSTIAKYQGQLSENSSKTLMDFIAAADAKAGKK